MRFQFFLFALSFLSLYPVAASAVEAGIGSGAQSMTVLGGDASARDCFHAATIAARRDFAGPGSIAGCTRALERSRLTERDRLATLVNRGILRLALRDLDGAAADFDAAIGMDPPSGEVFVDRGNMSYMSRSYERAIGDYTRALELGLEKDHIAYFNRAMAHEHLRNFNDAKADYQRAMERAPEWFLPRVRLDSLLQAAAEPAVTVPSVEH